MKKILFAGCLLLGLVSNSAFATHAYRSEICKSKNHNLTYKGNYPVGGMYGISLARQDIDVPALPLFDSETPNTLEDGEIIFSVKLSRVIEKGEISKDCGFDYEEWTSEKNIEVNLISNEAAEKLDLKQGDRLRLICEESTAFPNGTECN